jgi:hypothetical protein
MIYSKLERATIPGHVLNKLRRIIMTKRDIGLEILDGIREICAHKKGDARLKVAELSEPSPPQVIRSRLKISQSDFY